MARKQKTDDLVSYRPMAYQVSQQFFKDKTFNLIDTKQALENIETALLIEQKNGNPNKANIAVLCYSAAKICITLNLLKEFNNYVKIGKENNPTIDFPIFKKQP